MRIALSLPNSVERAASSFLEAHTGRFARGFAEAVAAARVHPFFAVLAELTQRLVEADVERRGLDPTPPPVPGDLLKNASDVPACGGCPTQENLGANDALGGPEDG